MEPRTAKLWADQDRRAGDREPLFAAVAGAIDHNVTSVLYPGSFVDIAPSFVFESVTYADMDDRANRFFADVDGVREIIETRTGDASAVGEFAFIHGDYREPLDLDDGTFDLLVSLYAGFVSEYCTRYLRVGGALLVNPSHGDAAMASIDDRYRLTAVVTSRDGRYRVSDADLDSYLIPKRDIEITREYLHDWGKAIGYTKSPFAYLFERVQ